MIIWKVLIGIVSNSKKKHGDFMHMPQRTTHSLIGKIELTICVKNTATHSHTAGWVYLYLCHRTGFSMHRSGCSKQVGERRLMEEEREGIVRNVRQEEKGNRVRMRKKRINGVRGVEVA